RGESEVAMSSAPDGGEQARLGELGEMGARGLGCDVRGGGELARGQGPAIEERRHHGGPRRVSDQRGDLGDDGTGDHQIALAAMLIIRASSATLKKNATTPWAATVRRMYLLVTPTSETCDVMPMTKEK